MENKVISSDEIKSIVAEYIRENFLYGKETMSLGDDLSFYNEGILDSTGVLELVEFVEENFQISVEDDELVPDNLDSLGKISAFIAKKMNA